MTKNTACKHRRHKGERTASLRQADTCRKFVVPKRQAAGWDSEPHSIAEQRTITDGRIVPVGKDFVRKAPINAEIFIEDDANRLGEHFASEFRMHIPRARCPRGASGYSG